MIKEFFIWGWTSYDCILKAFQDAKIEVIESKDEVPFYFKVKGNPKQIINICNDYGVAEFGMNKDVQ